jgi:hypothetical protein
MKRLECLVYVSSAVSLLTESELEAILSDALVHNELYGITGILLYNDGTFFQYIEGVDEDLEHIYSRITHSKKHHGMYQLIHKEIQERLFPDWYMGFFQPSKSEILTLIDQQWWTLASSELSVTEQSWEGLKLLESFCKNQQRFFS